MDAPTGQRDYSRIELSHHALERFVERFGGSPQSAEESLRRALARSRRLGRNRRNQAVAVLAVHESRMLVAILREKRCLTVMTWPQFAPRLIEFGRLRLPRKRGRMLRRLGADADSDALEPPPQSPTTAELDQA